MHLSEYPRYAGQLLGTFRVRHERALADARQQDTAPFLDWQQPLRILDLANGRLRPHYTLLRAQGHHVFGVDWVNHAPESATDWAYVLARRLFAWRAGVVHTLGHPPGLARSDVGALPFPDDCFDLITSIAAFEHFLEVPRVLAEMHRVLKPGGVAWVHVHLFTSPSGGHNVTFTEVPMRVMPRGVEPWDHLRQRRLPFTVPLNEWRRDQYLDAFRQRFTLHRHYCLTREGEGWLTPSLAAELAEYDRDELTCAALVIVARKA